MVISVWTRGKLPWQNWKNFETVIFTLHMQVQSLILTYILVYHQENECMLLMNKYKIIHVA